MFRRLRSWHAASAAFERHRDAHLALLQSRVHERRPRLLSSSMKTDLRYTTSDAAINLNAERGAEERQGAPATKKAKPKPAPKRRKKGDDGQGTLL